MKNEKELEANIQLLKESHIKPNFSALARAYGLDRRTVKKYYENGGIPKRKPKQEYSRWDPYEDVISEKLKDPEMTIIELYRLLEEELGDDKLPGTYGSLKAYLHKKNLVVLIDRTAQKRSRKRIC